MTPAKRIVAEAEQADFLRRQIAYYEGVEASLLAALTQETQK